MVIAHLFLCIAVEQVDNHYMTHDQFFKSLLSKPPKNPDKGYIIQAGCRKGFTNFNGKCRKFWWVDTNRAMLNIIECFESVDVVVLFQENVTEHQGLNPLAKWERIG